MPAAQPLRGPPRQALLTAVQTLRQRVAALEQKVCDLEVMLEMITDDQHVSKKVETMRKDLVQHAGAIFDQALPMLPVSWAKIDDG
jgi:hypothetical protein